MSFFISFDCEMRLISKVALSCFCLLLVPLATRAEPWRGIVPLRSTKRDVERLLGKPLRADDKLMRYELVNETVDFSLIGDAATTGESSHLSPDTIKSIQVYPKQKLLFADLGLAQEKIGFVRPSNPANIGYEGYVDGDGGLIVKALHGAIEVVLYFGNAKDRARCPSCTIDPHALANEPICVLCPTVMVTSPDEIQAGQNATFTVSVTTGSPPPKLTFNWTIDAGKIVEGQGTSAIVVDIKNVAGRSITATVEVSGIDPVCNRTASSSTQITKRPQN
jgi:hypothetical protein